jgi:hypothetical protein
MMALGGVGWCLVALARVCWVRARVTAYGCGTCRGETTGGHSHPNTM